MFVTKTAFWQKLRVSKQARTIIVSKATRVTVQALYNHRSKIRLNR